MTDISTDDYYMSRAIELARKGRFTTHPNPNVGCVIVNGDGNIVGEGWHEKAGEAHAEVHALAMAGNQAKNATVFVTLEPCSHQGKTGPCADALIKAEVARVVVAMEDPFEQVSGRGINKLREAGIEVDVGVKYEEARQLNLGFLSLCERKKPRIQLKLAMSLDGRTALSNGKSKWVTGKSARQDVHEGRACAGAILTGADTVLADNPQLNVRAETEELKALENLRQPVRVIIDTQCRLIPALQVFQDGVPVFLVRTKASEQELPEHVTEWVVPEQNEKADLTAVVSKIAELGIHSVWAECGAQLAGALVTQDLVDELLVYIAPKLMGNMAKPLVHLPDFAVMRDIVELKLSSMDKIGEDIKLIYQIAEHSQ
ncbi:MULTISPECIES: bifunctional diaminohydroxyphosphoribosylaminopyrimidine deaminase/5-amino-6-(5-phosphoribosylamino)uracil reductase RibD [Gammaproteobacteria]|uniref:bifunctional diaminohydroxyphosphoribosylaminopyrimidine deaminase/5-amino-6-(5-phosphoribosylamino)uracil reductase RibD n=1 Tax=Gammaproteobacteria TaxID=1236 RepID=UPI000DD08320|nr:MULTISPECIES: bifunctional diaminohydroxyphosphoribosylaminopyrimidine deaminase/5-amino-6-(5-phosphoribosylamino)uracil reductase RibD [Gammaproteobacteria]RTE86011.1 bifunctional diaminohydroxyphosphoribosylaminopyrimidine deaminase/5-amino-6-(5-phosphoribosylamino)uracil reductase RibD [Aliidiomarina sp. B3213]TCZ91365.1 bifunctional diaminohydroxyphosphoribosylaminopyrimidine deaminase/5-amino-6-(5-phosphoribosylamino)uracil reductase RibD [Lysobacter sp. N42]